MINGKKERFEKILIVRHKNLKVRKGRRATYICLVVLYFVLDLMSIGIGIGVEAPAIIFIFSMLKAITIGAMTVCICTQLFANDRHNNQVGIEQRSGYDNFDIYMSRLIELFVAYLIVFVISAVLNGAIYGGLIHGKMTKGIFANEQDPLGKWVPGSVMRITIDFLIIDLWYGLVTFILTAAICIGCSYVMNSAGVAMLGIVFGIGIAIIIMLASVGTFTHAGFMSTIPGFGHNYFGVFSAPDDDK